MLQFYRQKHRGKLQNGSLLRQGVLFARRILQSNVLFFAQRSAESARCGTCLLVVTTSWCAVNVTISDKKMRRN